MSKIEKINEEKLENIKGGTMMPVWIGIGVSAITMFIIGIIKGITNPERCGA